jgi:tetratricopeptide (TPR) repeat protein
LEQALTEAEAALRQGEKELAESHYRSALLEGWLLVGSLHVTTGDYPAASEAFDQAGTVSLQTRRATLARSVLYLELEQTRRAIALLRDQVARQPQDREARRLFARALMADGQPAEALQELEALRNTAPEDLENAFTLATGYLRLDRPDRAAELFEEIARTEGTPQVWILVGRTYRDFGEHQRAREALGTALELDPRAPRAEYYLGTVELMDQGRAGLDAAEAHFRRELELRPDDPVTNLFLGLALVEGRRYEDAIAPLEIAAGIDDPQADALHFLGEARLGLGQLNAAERALRRAVELAGSELGRGRPDQLSSIHYQLAQTLRRQGDEAAARHHFERAQHFAAELATDSRDRLARYLSSADDREERADLFVSMVQSLALPGLSPAHAVDLRRQVQQIMARAYLNLGILEVQAQRPATATDLLQTAASLAPTLPQLQRSLGVSAFQAERYEEAKEPLARALEEQPEDRALRNMLAMAWLNTEGYERAAELLAADPQRSLSPQLEYAYGLALVRSGRAEEAQPIFDRLLRQHGDWPELNVLLGQAHAERGDYPAAERFLRRALELAPDVAEAHGSLGLLYLRQGKLDAAQQELEQEVTAHPGDLQSRFHLATVLDLNQETVEARRQLRLILDSAPNHGDARYLLGKILLTAGEAEAAAEQLEVALKLQPDEPNVHNQLGQAYQKLGRREQAAERFAAFRELKAKQREPSP